MNIQFIKTFKYRVSFTDGKFSVRINLLFYVSFTVVSSNTCVFLFCRPFVVNTTFSTGRVGVETEETSDRHLYRLGVDGRLLTLQILIIKNAPGFIL